MVTVLYGIGGSCRVRFDATVMGAVKKAAGVQENLNASSGFYFYVLDGEEVRRGSNDRTVHLWTFSRWTVENALLSLEPMLPEHMRHTIREMGEVQREAALGEVVPQLYLNRCANFQAARRIWSQEKGSSTGSMAVNRLNCLLRLLYNETAFMANVMSVTESATALAATLFPDEGEKKLLGLLRGFGPVQS